MKFALVGSHCSGKTTTLWHVGAFLKMQGVTDFTMIQEVARRCPYLLNRKTTFETCNWILLQQILAEAEAHRKWRHIITDRSVFDQYIYFRESVENRIKNYLTNKVHWKELFDAAPKVDYLLTIVNAWHEVQPYDKIFWFRPLKLVADADRPNDLDYQKSIDSLFLDYFKGAPNVVEVGSVGFKHPQPRKLRATWVANQILKMIQK